MKYQYRLLGWGDLYTFESTHTMPEYIVEEAAEDFYANHDGNAERWPQPIELYKEDVSLGIFTVDIEFEAVFLAVKVC
jgi:hypothetical protein